MMRSLILILILFCITLKSYAATTTESVTGLFLNGWPGTYGYISWNTSIDPNNLNNNVIPNNYSYIIELVNHYYTSAVYYGADGQHKFQNHIYIFSPVKGTDNSYNMMINDLNNNATYHCLPWPPTN